MHGYFLHIGYARRKPTRSENGLYAVIWNRSSDTGNSALTQSIVHMLKSESNLLLI